MPEGRSHNARKPRKRLPDDAVANHVTDSQMGAPIQGISQLCGRNGSTLDSWPTGGQALSSLEPLILSDRNLGNEEKNRGRPLFFIAVLGINADGSLRPLISARIPGGPGTWPA